MHPVGAARQVCGQVGIWKTAARSVRSKCCVVIKSAQSRRDCFKWDVSSKPYLLLKKQLLGWMAVLEITFLF